jgi:site-specific recombinase XerD
MAVEDYYPERKRYNVRLHEKGNKFHTVPVHHVAEEYLDAYIEAAGIAEEKKSPLFRSFGKFGRGLSEKRISRFDAWSMIKRRKKRSALKRTLLIIRCAHRHHDLSLERRNGRESAADRRPREQPDNEALRQNKRQDHT